MTTPRRAPSLASALAALVAMLACGCARAPAASPAIVSMRVPAVATTPPRNADGTLNALVEIPAGTNEKWEASESDPTLLEWERLDGGARRVVRYLAYPANYGMVPGTLQRAEDGGDGDPLDVVVLGPALPRGALVAVRPIAVLALLDDGEVDDKIVAVPASGPFSEVDDLAALRARFPGVDAILEAWFTHYKGAGRTESRGWRDRAAAEEIVERAVRAALPR
ncbi:MAG: inorganic diphosphatase [Myxococcota bacterium]